MLINQGGYPNTTASINVLTEAVGLKQPPRVISINQGSRHRKSIYEGGRLKMSVSINDCTKK
jgi:hypothetical protein